MKKTITKTIKELIEIKEIFEASEQIKQCRFYTGDLKNIIKNRKNRKNN